MSSIPAAVVTTAEAAHQREELSGSDQIDVYRTRFFGHQFELRSHA